MRKKGARWILDIILGQQNGPALAGPSTTALSGRQ